MVPPLDGARLRLYGAITEVAIPGRIAVLERIAMPDRIVRQDCHTGDHEARVVKYKCLNLYY